MQDTGIEVGDKVFAVLWLPGHEDGLEREYSVIEGMVGRVVMRNDTAISGYVVAGHFIPAGWTFDAKGAAEAKRWQLIDEKGRQAADNERYR